MSSLFPVRADEASRGRCASITRIAARHGLALHERSDLVASQRLRAERPLNARYLRDLRCSPIGDEHKSVGSGSR